MYDIHGRYRHVRDTCERCYVCVEQRINKPAKDDAMSLHEDGVAWSGTWPDI